MALSAADKQFLADITHECDPATPLEFGDSRYVPLDAKPGDGQEPVRGKDVVLPMLSDIGRSSGSTTQLLAGFRGSGKSTELRRLKHALEDAGYDVVLKDAQGFLNLTTELDVSGFLIALGAALEEGLAPLLAEAGAPPRKKTLAEIVSEYFKKRSLKVEGFEVGGDYAGFTAKLVGSLRVDPSFKDLFAEHMKGLIYEFSGEFRAWINDLLTFFRTHRAEKKGLVFIFDGVDHIRGIGPSDQRAKVQRSVEAVFGQFSEMLRFDGLHVVYTVPVYLPFLNPALAGLFGSPVKRVPMTKEHERGPERPDYARGIEALKLFATRRIHEPERLLGPDWGQSLHAMARASGGYLRDLLRLLLAVIETADAGGVLPVPPYVVEREIAELRDEYRRAVTPEDAKVLKRVADTFSVEDVPDEYRVRLADLFETHVTMCYLNGEEWYDVHPLILDRVMKVPAA